MFPMNYVHRDFVFSDEGPVSRTTVKTGENPLRPEPGLRFYEHQLSYLAPHDPYILRFDCGLSYKPAGYTIRNRVRPQLLFEFIVAGEQVYNGTPLHAGDFVIVEPYSTYTAIAGEENVTILWCAWEGDILSTVAETLKHFSSARIYHLDIGDTLMPMFTSAIYNRHYAVLDLDRYVRGFTDQLLALLTVVDRAPAEPSPLVRRALGIIAREYSSITVEALARQLFVAPGYLCRAFHRDMGIPPKQYITQTKLAFAVFYLTNTNQSIKQIADAVGYANYANFYAAFRAQYGMSPDAYRRAYGYEKNNVDQKM